MTWLVLFMIWISNGMFPKMHIPGYFRVFLLIGAVLSYTVYNKRRAVINKKYIFPYLIMIILQLFTIAVNGLYFSFDTILIMSLTCGLLWCSNISKDEFMNGYRSAIMLIAVGSILLYFIGLVTHIYNVLPQAILNSTDFDGTYTILGTFVVIVRNSYTYYRNYGIFSEPGQFQIFLSIGLIFELFHNENINYKRLIVYLLAYVTCDSTNGYITGSLIVIAYLFKTHKKIYGRKEKNFRRLLWIACISVIIIACTTYESNSFIIGIMGKLGGLSSSYTYSSLGTGVERRRAFDVALQIFLKNPLTGLGYRGMISYITSLSGGKFIMTFSPLNWFARFGLIYGVLANVSYISAFIKKSGIVSTIILVIAVITMISAQAVGADFMTSIIMMYGFIEAEGNINRVWTKGE